MKRVVMQPGKPSSGDDRWLTAKHLRIAALGCAIAGAVAVTAGPAASADAAARPVKVKYYVVQSPSHGHKEYLFEIAAKTLGNGKLDRLIFRLNEGRLEPGGVRLVNPTIIRPGWILLLPRRAHGPGVHYGVLPAVTHTGKVHSSPSAKSSSPPATHSPAPSASATHSPAAHPSTAQSGAAPSPTATPATRSAPVTTRSQALGRDGAIAGLAVAVILMVGLPILIRRRARRRSRPARSGPVAGWSDPIAPPAEHSADGTDAAEDARSDAWLEADDDGLADHDLPAKSWPSWLGVQDLPAESLPSSLEPSSLDAPDGDIAVPTGEPDLDTADYVDDSHPAQEHRVWLGDDRIEVRLAAAATAGAADAPRLTWTELPYDLPADGEANACIGTGDQGCLFVDLASCPGIVAIGGDQLAAVRLMESLSFQLAKTASAGSPCAVTLVGEIVPEPRPAGASWVSTPADLDSVAMRADVRTEIVFCAPRDEADALELARYTQAAARHVVPVLLADLPDAPWYLAAWPQSGEGDQAGSLIPAYAASAR